MKCDLPPPGWFCTRDAPHDGPCAAWPDDRRDVPAGDDEAFADRAYATQAKVGRFKMKLRLLLVVLGGGGPALLFLADRVAHAFGICLGF